MDELGLLKGMLEIYSPSCNESQLAGYLVSEMAKLGFNARIDEAGNAVGEIGEGKTILLVGHIDTVNGQIPVRIEGDNLYGRGAVDAKGALAAFIMAAAQNKGKRVVVVGAVEEETASSKGARNLIGKYQPEAIIIGEPSNVSGITLGYKGRLLIKYSLRREMAHTASNKFSVADEAVEFYNKLKGYASSSNMGKSGIDSLQIILRDFNTRNEDFYQEAALDIRFRTPAGFESKEIISFINSIKGNAEVSAVLEDAPYQTDKNNFLVRAFVKAIRNNGLGPSFLFKSGTSDMNILGPEFNVPIVAYGPGDSALDHTPNEHISIKEYEKSIKILLDVLTTL